ncbi:unnamed protein product [Amaranthus hypochondriacus]
MFPNSEIMFVDERPFTEKVILEEKDLIRTEFMAHLDDLALRLTMAMDVDENDSRHVFGKVLLTPENNKLADADFFSFFADDFDDTDIN